MRSVLATLSVLVVACASSAPPGVPSGAAPLGRATSGEVLEGTTLVDAARFLPLEARVADVGGVEHLAFRRGTDEVVLTPVPPEASPACVALPADGWAWTFAARRPLVLVLGADALLFARARPDCWVRLALVPERPRGPTVSARGKTIDAVELALDPLGPELAGVVVRHGGSMEALTLRAKDAPEVVFTEDEQIPEWEPSADQVGVDGVGAGRRELSATVIGRDPLALLVTSDEEGWDDPGNQGGAVHATRTVTWRLDKIDGAWTQGHLHVGSRRSSSGDGAQISDSSARSERLIPGRDATLRGGEQRIASTSVADFGGHSRSHLVVDWELDRGSDAIALTLSRPATTEATTTLTSEGATRSATLGGCVLVLEPTLLDVRCGTRDARFELLDDVPDGAATSVEVAVWVEPGALWIELDGAATWKTEHVEEDGGTWTSDGQSSLRRVVVVSRRTADVVTISQGVSSSDR